MKKTKKGDASFEMIVVIILGLVFIGSGIVLLDKIYGFLPRIGGGAENLMISASVYPQRGLSGTVFKISAEVDDENVYEVRTKIGDSSIALFDDGRHGDRAVKDGVYAGTWDSANSSLSGVISGTVVARTADKEYTGHFNFQISDNFCTSLMDNGNSDEKIDIEFIGAGYSDLEDLKADVEKYADFNGENFGIFSYSPFKENKAKFNVDYLDNYYSLDDLGCQMGCRGVDSLVCCDDRKVAKISSQCSADQVIILINDERFCASSSSYAKVCTKGTYNQPRALVHELGHSLGGLGDEYDYGIYPDFTKITNYNYPNCVTDCSKWPANIPAGCFLGCGYPEFSRPEEQDSIMYTYADRFNDVCIYYLNKNLEGYNPDISNNLPAPDARKYLLEFNYSDGGLGFENVYVAPGKAPDRRNIDSGMQVFVRARDNRLIHSSYFRIGNIEYPFFKENSNEKPFPFLAGEIGLSLIVPYFVDAATIEIYNGSEVISSVDVAYLGNSCGNNKCDAPENYETCDKDCSQNQDSICSAEKDGVCDIICSEGIDQDCRNYKKIIWLGILLLVLAVVIIALVLRYRRRAE
jgi:hypothetical protein